MAPETDVVLRRQLSAQSLTPGTRQRWKCCEAPRSAARFLSAPMLTIWAVHTGSATVGSRSAAMVLASVLFSPLNLTRKHTDNWINWISKHVIMVVICQLYIIEATELHNTGNQHFVYTVTTQNHYYRRSEVAKHVQC